MSLTDDPLIGRQLGDYRVVDILGRGGMAHVYRGYDANLQRYAAVKVIDANLLAKENEDEYRERFQREARAVARLTHPNIVGMYQFGEVGPLYYMAMAFIDGRDLGQILKEHAANGTTMPQAQILQIIRDISEALDYAHAGGVIHRDIKPSNIMVAVDNRAILTDFGLALSVPEGSIGNTFGSAHYIAPEQAISSANAVAQSDLYSLGVVLYQMLTGKVPFDDPSAMSVALKHLSDPPMSPRILNPELSPAVEKVVLKALEKEPSKRYQNGESLAAALEEAMLSGKAMTQEHLASITSSRPSRMFPLITLTKEQPEEVKSSPTPQFDESRLAAARAQFEQARRRLNRSNNRMPLVGGLAVVLMLIVLAGVWVITRNRATGEPSPTAVAAAVTEDATTRAPTLTGTTASGASTASVSATKATRVSSQTPASATPVEVVLAPTNTSTVNQTSTKTTTPTRTPTAMDLPTDIFAVMPPMPTDQAAAQIWLFYDSTRLVLINRSSQSVSIRGWEFLQEASFGQITFYSSQWQTPLLSSVQSGQCYIIWPNNRPDAATPDYCTNREAWFSAGTFSRFWLSSHPGATFKVLDANGNELAVCRVDASVCSIKVSS